MSIFSFSFLWILWMPLDDSKIAYKKYMLRFIFNLVVEIHKICQNLIIGWKKWWENFIHHGWKNNHINFHNFLSLKINKISILWNLNARARTRKFCNVQNFRMNQFSITKKFGPWPKNPKSVPKVIQMWYVSWAIKVEMQKCENEVIFGAEAERKVCKIFIFGSSKDPKIMKGQFKN